MFPLLPWSATAARQVGSAVRAKVRGAIQVLGTASWLLRVQIQLLHFLIEGLHSYTVEIYQIESVCCIFFKKNCLKNELGIGNELGAYVISGEGT